MISDDFPFQTGDFQVLGEFSRMKKLLKTNEFAPFAPLGAMCGFVSGRVFLKLNVAPCFTVNM